MFSYITSLINNPRETLIFILLAFPGRIMAICAHEYAHAWVADRCGDPTARNCGRLTINPTKHLDLLGLIMMMLIGFGWAKPVPVNPRNYRNYRKDDLKVSIAGICMNLALFLIGYIILTAMIVFALRSVPHTDSTLLATGTNFVTNYNGMKVFVSGNYYFPLTDIFRSATAMSDYLITPVFGRLAGYVYSMISYFVEVNLILAVFNLIPLPPLDGYHVFNDLLLHRSLFANPNTVRYAYIALMLLVFSGIIGIGLSYVYTWTCSGFGSLISALLGLTGLL